MAIKIQPFVAEIEFVVGSETKRGIYKATVLNTVLDRGPDGYQRHIANIGNDVRKSDMEKVLLLMVNLNKFG